MFSNKSMSEVHLCNINKEEKVEDEDIFKKNFKLHKDIVESLIKEAFQMFDEDGSGEIDAREFKKVIKSLGLNMNDDNIKEIMKKIGKNHSGYIDLEEFTEVMLNHQIKEQITVNEHLENTFTLYDKDQDGIISEQDLIRVSKEVEDILGSEEASLIISFTKLLCYQFNKIENKKNGISKEEFFLLLYNLGFVEEKNEQIDILIPKTKTNILMDSSKVTKNNSLSLRESDIDLHVNEN